MAAISKLTSKAQTVIPKEIRERMRLNPGDSIRYRVTPAGVLIERIDATDDDPFAEFSEWAGAEDDKAYASL